MITHQGGRRAISPIQSEERHPGRIEHRGAFKKSGVLTVITSNRFVTDHIFTDSILRHKRHTPLGVTSTPT